MLKQKKRKRGGGGQGWFRRKPEQKDYKTRELEMRMTRRDTVKVYVMYKKMREETKRMGTDEVEESAQSG